jgi:hypothetical protein
MSFGNHKASAICCQDHSLWNQDHVILINLLGKYYIEYIQKVYTKSNRNTI